MACYYCSPLPAYCVTASSCLCLSPCRNKSTRSREHTSVVFTARHRTRDLRMGGRYWREVLNPLKWIPHCNMSKSTTPKQVVKLFLWLTQKPIRNRLWTCLRLKDQLSEENNQVMRQKYIPLSNLPRQGGHEHVRPGSLQSDTQVLGFPSEASRANHSEMFHPKDKV